MSVLKCLICNWISKVQDFMNTYLRDKEAGTILYSIQFLAVSFSDFVRLFEVVLDIIWLENVDYSCPFVALWDIQT